MTGRDLRALLALVGVVAVGVVAWQRLPDPPLADFAEYWAAGRLILAGENPWDIEQVRTLENEAGRPGEPVLMWNPPWALTLVVPLGMLGVRPAYWLWQAANALTLLGAIWLLARLYAPNQWRAQAGVGCLTFFPVYIALAQGQIAGLLPLGAALVLWAIEAEREFLVGLAATLLSIKPQVGYLVWVALGLWIVAGRRWRVVAGLACGIGVCLLPPLLLNPQVITQYREAVVLHPPTQYATPTWGTFLRLAIGTEQFWLQSVTPCLGMVWLGLYWWTRPRWNWLDEFPLIAGVSVASMGYGWFYDLVLMLPGVAQVTGMGALPRGGVVVYLLLNLVAFLQVLAGAHGMWYVWAAPAFLGLQLYLRRREAACPHTLHPVG
ncbi:MAG: glycosyltransferase family 87 protein [Gemmataceae bacterium]